MKKEIQRRIIQEIESLGLRGTVTTQPGGRHSRILVIHRDGHDQRIPLSNTLGRDDRQWKNFRSQLRKLVSEPG